MRPQSQLGYLAVCAFNQNLQDEWCRHLTSSSVIYARASHDLDVVQNLYTCVSIASTMCVRHWVTSESTLFTRPVLQCAGVCGKCVASVLQCVAVTPLHHGTESRRSGVCLQHFDAVQILGRLDKASSLWLLAGTKGHARVIFGLVRLGRTVGVADLRVRQREFAWERECLWGRQSHNLDLFGLVGLLVLLICVCERELVYATVCVWEKANLCVRARGVCGRAIFKRVRPGRAVGVAICLCVSEGGSGMSGSPIYACVWESKRVSLYVRERETERVFLIWYFWWWAPAVNFLDKGPFCIHARTHEHTHTHTYTCSDAYVGLEVVMWETERVCVCVKKSLCVRVCVCEHLCVCERGVCVLLMCLAHTHSHTHTRTCTRTCCDENLGQKVVVI